MEPLSSKVSLCHEAASSSEGQGAEKLHYACLFADNLSTRARDTSYIQLATELKARKCFSQAFEAASKINEAVRRIPVFKGILLEMVKERDFNEIFTKGLASLASVSNDSKEADRSLASVVAAVSEAAELVFALQIIDFISDPYVKLEALAQLARRLFDNDKLKLVMDVEKKFYALLTSQEVNQTCLQQYPLSATLKRGIVCFAAASGILENEPSCKKFTLYQSFSWGESDERDVLKKTLSSLFRQSKFSDAITLIHGAQIEDSFKRQFYVDGAQIVIQKKNWESFDEIIKKIKALPGYPFHDTIPNPFQTLGLSLAQAGEKERAEKLILAETDEFKVADALASLGCTIVEADPDFACALVKRIFSLSYAMTFPSTKYKFAIKLIKAGKLQVAKEFYEKSSAIGNPYVGSINSFVVALLEANEDEYVANMKLPQDFNFEGIVIGLVEKKLFQKALQVAKYERDPDNKYDELLLVLSEMIKAGLLPRQEVEDLLKTQDPVSLKVAGKVLVLIGSEMVKANQLTEVKNLIETHFKPEALPIIYRRIASEVLLAGHLGKLVAFCNFISPLILPEFEKAAALAFQKKNLKRNDIMVNIPLMMIREGSSESGVPSLTARMEAMKLKESGQ